MTGTNNGKSGRSHSPRLDHEFPRELIGWLNFQRTNDDRLVQRISRNDLKGERRDGEEEERDMSYLPVIEDRETESLSLCVSTKISLEAERIHHRNEGLRETS